VGWRTHAVAARAIVEIGMNDLGGRWLGLTGAGAARRLVLDGTNALTLAREPTRHRIGRFFRGQIAW
jgi:hypothetical protein